jgi:transposase-like protein
MPRFKPKKVATPGSTPVSLPVSKKGRGRPKKVVKKVGTSRVGNYRNKYSDRDLQLAIRAVESNKMKISAAAKRYNIPKTTLYDRLSGKSKATLGRPTELTPEEEQIIVERLVVMADWAFPLTNRDLRVLIKEYLEVQGRTT